MSRQRTEQSFCQCLWRQRQDQSVCQCSWRQRYQHSPKHRSLALLACVVTASRVADVQRALALRREVDAWSTCALGRKRPAKSPMLLPAHPLRWPMADVVAKG
eukprot:7141024-Prymnesium_polylepis.1